MALTWFFSFRGTKSPKLNLGSFLALKTSWKTIFDNFRLLSLATKGRQISMDITVEKSKISKILSFNGVMHLKWKLRTCTIQIELEKIGLVIKKNNFIDIFWFSPKAWGPQKIFDFWFFQFFEKETPNLALWRTEEQSQEVWFSLRVFFLPR